jgi:hypothetical protein
LAERSQNDQCFQWQPVDGHSSGKSLLLEPTVPSMTPPRSGLFANIRSAREDDRFHGAMGAIRMERCWSLSTERATSKRRVDLYEPLLRSRVKL